jgi:hypothetical protein
MNKKSWLLAIFVAFSCCACAVEPTKKTAAATAGGDDWQTMLRNASPLRQLSAAECTAPAGGSCVIDITIGDGCNVTVRPEHVKVPAKVFVFWKIAPQTWSFVQEKGIAFKNAGPFTDSRRVADQVWRVTVKDVKETWTYYPYAINVRSRDGKTCTIDPGMWV